MTGWAVLNVLGVGIAVLLLMLLVPSFGRGIDRRLARHSRLGT